MMYLKAALFVAFLHIGLASHALDNPDAPDYVGTFLQRAQPYEQYIQEEAITTLAYTDGFAQYLHFLATELDAAYQALLPYLDEATQQRLQQSQKQWVAYRDAEFEFIHNNWTRDNFGTSSVIAAGNYRAMLVKTRVLLLLKYRSNYQATNDR